MYSHQQGKQMSTNIQIHCCEDIHTACGQKLFFISLVTILKNVSNKTCAH